MVVLMPVVGSISETNSADIAKVSAIQLEGSRFHNSVKESTKHLLFAAILLNQFGAAFDSRAALYIRR